MHRGSCLCGKVRYEYSGAIEEISRCHCRQCQKAQGGAFVAVAPVRSHRFSIVEGQSLLKEFRASPGKVRVFCTECGSPLYSARDDLPEVKRLRVGTLDTNVGNVPQYHAFVDFNPEWYEICDDHPCFAERADATRR